jgi:hypothetical protein
MLAGKRLLGIKHKTKSDKTNLSFLTACLSLHMAASWILRCKERPQFATKEKEQRLYCVIGHQQRKP